MMSITSTTGQIVKKLARNLPMWQCGICVVILQFEFTSYN